MELILMCHQYTVALFKYTSEKAMELLEIYDESRLPFQVQFAPDRNDAFSNWMHERLIPDNRDDINLILTKAKADNTFDLALKANCMSLSDGYWVKKTSSRLRWETSNFYDNEFSHDVGNYILTGKGSMKSKYSPDFTTPGILKKAWRKRNDKIFLLKMGRPLLYEEPLNETAISLYLSRQKNVPFVRYYLDFISDKPISVCENFLDSKTDFISAWDLYLSAPSKNTKNMNVDEYLCERFDYFHIPDAVDFLFKLRVLDMVIGNKDRHLNNFGFLRDASSMRFLGPAPVYDNGSSLWCGDEIIELDEQALQKELHGLYKTFHKHISKDMFTSFLDIENCIKSCYKSSFIPEKRMNEIIACLDHKIHVLDKLLAREMARETELFLSR